MQTEPLPPMNGFDMRGKWVLVTGASSGLGAHFAQRMAQAGAHVVLAARRADALAAQVQAIEAQGGRAHALTLDVSDAAQVCAALAQMAEQRGLPDVLINNAGVTVGRAALAQSVDDFDHVMNTNVRGAWLVATELARLWVAAQRGGVVVNVASILGERVAGGVAPYAMSKAAVVQMTKALALEWARLGIRVNALLPGYVVTDLNRDFLASPAGDKLRERIPSRRFCQLHDLDGPLLLLASDAGAAMTGTTLAVDGGHLVSGL